MSGKIPFSLELAKRLYKEIPDLMDEYSFETNGGNTVNACAFCGMFKYIGSGKSIQHSKNCLGVETLKELDKEFNP